MAKCKEWAIFHTTKLVLHLTLLGFAINWKKSTPSHANSRSTWELCSTQKGQKDRQMALQEAVLRLWWGAAVTALTVMQVLGLKAVCHPVVPLGLLHMRRLQWWFASLRLDPKRHKYCIVKYPHQCRRTCIIGDPHSICVRDTTGLSDFLHSGVHRCMTGWRAPARGEQ